MIDLIKVQTTDEVIKNSNGDVFIKKPSGILEIYFSRNIEFKLYSSTVTFAYLYVVNEVPIPTDIAIIDTVHISAILDTAGKDACVSSISIGYAKTQKPLKYIHSFYTIAPGSDSTFSKTVHFHIIGFWK